MANDDTAPATKGDIRRLEKHIDEKVEETKRHFDVVAEHLKHDYDGIFGDRTSQHQDKLVDHEKRLSVVEEKLGLAMPPR